MPDRYSICTPKEQLEQRLKVEIPEGYLKRYNAAPSQLLPVITNESPRGFSFFYWGIDPKWSNNKNISQKLINAEKPKLLEKPSYRKALKERRCLVPADGFYGWKLIGKKSRVPHRIILNQTAIFCMAGLWEEYQDEGNEVVHTFSIITTEANDLIAPISSHMPAILDPKEEKNWLDDSLDTDSFLDLLKPYPSDHMGLYTVSPIINSINVNVPSMIQPVPPVDQFGNYTLFN